MSKFVKWLKWHFGEHRKQCCRCYKTFYKPKVIYEEYYIDYEQRSMDFKVCPHCKKCMEFIEV
jgi:hypothetical protein